VERKATQYKRKNQIVKLNTT